MGTKGKEIAGPNVEKVIESLNRALADEWLAYYQYWVGAKVIRGPHREAAVGELLQHAADELRHAEMLATRILQLDGTPILKPAEWYKATNCGYDAPEDPAVDAVLKQNIAGEQCAIGVYQALAGEVKGTDPITYNLAVQILADEVEHEDDLQTILEDIEMIAKR